MRLIYSGMVWDIRFFGDALLLLYKDSNTDYIDIFTDIAAIKAFIDDRPHILGEQFCIAGVA